MRFSYCMLPDYPLADSIEMIKTADDLGFYACYSVDETWHKDLWALFAAAADKTERIRFGPNVTHVFLREPTLICQQVATLDELTGATHGAGRVARQLGAGCRRRTGSTGAIRSRSHGSSRPSTRRRPLLDSGRHHFRGRLLPLQRPLHVLSTRSGPDPDQDGGMKVRGPSRRPESSPKGCTTRCRTGSRRRTIRRRERTCRRRPGATRLARARPRRLGRDRRLRPLRRGQARGAIVPAFYISTPPPSSWPVTGSMPRSFSPGGGAGRGRRADGAVELFRPEYAEKLSIAGTPEECVEKIKTDIQLDGRHHWRSPSRTRHS